MLILRCIGINRLLGLPTQLSIPTRGHSSVLHRIKDFFSREKNSFHEDFLERVHSWDGISREKWTLIYRDIAASRTSLLVSTIMPAFFMGVALISYDISRSNKSDRPPHVERLMRDIEELGVLIWLPAIALVVTIIMILRIHHYRPLRIYQNRNNVDQYIAIGARIVGQKEILFDRSNVSSVYFAEDQSDTVKLGLTLIFGNIKVGEKGYFVADHLFKGNNYRSYMLSETSVAPRL